MTGLAGSLVPLLLSSFPAVSPEWSFTAREDSARPGFVGVRDVQDPGPGIDREFARARRQRLGDVAYQVEFDLRKQDPVIRGRIELRFEVTGSSPPSEDLFLDFAGTALEDVLINSISPGRSIGPNDGHLRLPADRLVSGSNTFEATFESSAAATGAPVTRYVDPTDGEEYLYSLLVPADAHRLFPCFDQPDVKARFRLELILPNDWSAVANADISDDPEADGLQTFPSRHADGRKLMVFRPTAPISTYLFAFAAGPFEIVEDPRPSGVGTDPSRPTRIFLRKAKTAHLERDALFRMHRQALDWLGTWFGTPYPFDKLDIALLPGFPYGGMEHAGAIFYRESALVFERRATVYEQVRRSTLIYHEVAHQWFGNLVTMEWFDDLWLKEGFATFLGYSLLAELEPERQAWLRFLQQVKPAAYQVDATEGTTPIYQELRNLADAKSAYGAIVYNKAPAVLRELEARLGAEAFRRGVQAFVQRHAYGNATWRDLIAALQETGGLRGSRWSDRWILGRGMPRVSAEWTTDDDGKLASFVIHQGNASAPSSDQSWPLSLDVLLIDDGGSGDRRVRVTIDESRVEVASLVGEPAPAAVLLNPTDIAYGEFTLDPTSLEFLTGRLSALGDPLLQAVAIAALRQAVRDAELDPARFATLLLGQLREETDSATHAWLLGLLEPVVQRYLDGPVREQALAVAEQMLLSQLRDTTQPDRSLEVLRFLAANLSTPPVLEALRALLDGTEILPGIQLAPRDRFVAATALYAAGDEQAIDREQKRSSPQDDVAREVYVAGAAGADPATKKRYFATYLQPDEPPEQWIEGSLATFHRPGQSNWTLPYLRPALDQVEWVKANRKIFFMPRWIDAFVNGHASRAALDIVQTFLDERDDLPEDIRRKILQSVDELKRVVRSRERFGGG